MTENADQFFLLPVNLQFYYHFLPFRQTGGEDESVAYPCAGRFSLLWPGVVPSKPALPRRRSWLNHPERFGGDWTTNLDSYGQSITGTFIGMPLIYVVTAPSDGRLTIRLS